MGAVLSSKCRLAHAHCVTHDFMDLYMLKQHEGAVLYDFIAFANGINGVELSSVSNISLSGFKVADNARSGIVLFYNSGEWGGPQITVSDCL